VTDEDFQMFVGSPLSLSDLITPVDKANKRKHQEWMELT
jgi:hypothetical protein